jgi:hypothetical protein
MVFGMNQDRKQLIAKIGSLSKNVQQSKNAQLQEAQRRLDSPEKSMASQRSIKGSLKQKLSLNIQENLIGLVKMHGANGSASSKFDQSIQSQKPCLESSKEQYKGSIKPIYSSREGNKSTNVSPRGMSTANLFQDKYAARRNLGDDSYQRHSVVAAASTKDSISMTNNPSTSLTKSNHKRAAPKGAANQSSDLQKIKTKMGMILAQYKNKVGSLEKENTKLQKELQRYRENFPDFV